VKRLVFSTAALLASIVCTGLLRPVTSEAQLEFPRAKGWVNDFGNVIDADAGKRLTALCTEVDRKAHAQIVVVTIDSLGGTPIDDYAYSLFNHWSIGRKGENRGILILLAMSDRKWRIEVGHGLQTLFPNERVAGIGAEMVPELKQKHYSKAVLHVSSEIANIIAGERGVTLTTVGPSPVP
jgi:uncharacterized protein